ncbi:MAG: potassium channel family protein [Gemmatimonadales bacterium]
MKLKDYSPLTWLFERSFRLLEWLPPSNIATAIHGRRSKISSAALLDPKQTAIRARSVERFLMGYFGCDLLGFGSMFSSVPCFRLAGAAWAVLRITAILQVTMNVALFDRLRGRTDNRIASLSRMVVLAFLNFGELLVCFATIYSFGLSLLSNASDPWDALYFSVTTQLTIGYGDITPTGVLRAVVVCQALSGLVFGALVFARFVAALPPITEILSPESDEE